MPLLCLPSLKQGYPDNQLILILSNIEAHVCQLLCGSLTNIRSIDNHRLFRWIQIWVRKISLKVSQLAFHRISNLCFNNGPWGFDIKFSLFYPILIHYWFPKLQHLRIHTSEQPSFSFQFRSLSSCSLVCLQQFLISRVACIMHHPLASSHHKSLILRVFQIIHLFGSRHNLPARHDPIDTIGSQHIHAPLLSSHPPTTSSLLP